MVQKEDEHEKRRGNTLVREVNVNDVGDEFLKRIYHWPEYRSRGLGSTTVGLGEYGRVEKQGHDNME